MSTKVQSKIIYGRANGADCYALVGWDDDPSPVREFAAVLAVMIPTMRCVRYEPLA